MCGADTLPVAAAAAAIASFVPTRHPWPPTSGTSSSAIATAVAVAAAAVAISGTSCGQCSEDGGLRFGVRRGAAAHVGPSESRSLRAGSGRTVHARQRMALLPSLLEIAPIEAGSTRDGAEPRALLEMLGEFMLHPKTTV